MNAAAVHHGVDVASSSMGHCHHREGAGGGGCHGGGRYSEVHCYSEFVAAGDCDKIVSIIT